MDPLSVTAGIITLISTIKQCRDLFQKSSRRVRSDQEVVSLQIDLQDLEVTLMIFQKYAEETWNETMFASEPQALYAKIASQLDQLQRTLAPVHEVLSTAPLDHGTTAQQLRLRKRLRKSHQHLQLAKNAVMLCLMSVTQARSDHTLQVLSTTLEHPSTWATQIAPCPCSCHDQKIFKSPGWLSHVLGQLRTWYPACATGSCCTHPACLGLIYHCPHWLYSCAIQLRCSNSRSGWTVSVRIPRIIPSDHPVFDLCRDGDLAGCKALLEFCAVSLFDQDPLGNSMLHVGMRQCPRYVPLSTDSRLGCGQGWT